MNDNEKLMWMFTEIHGPITGACYTELVFDENENPIAVNVMKNGNLCWTVAKADLVFDLLIKRHEASVSNFNRFIDEVQEDLHGEDISPEMALQRIIELARLIKEHVL